MRGGDHPAGLRGVRTGRTAYVGRVLGFFESFPFFQIRRRLRAFVGPVAQYAFIFSVILVGNPIHLPEDLNLHIFHCLRFVQHKSNA